MGEIVESSTDSGGGTILTTDIIKEIEEYKINGAGKLDGGPVSMGRNLYEKHGITEEQYNKYADLLKKQVNTFIEGNEEKIKVLTNKKELSDSDCFDTLLIILAVLKVLKDNYFGIKAFHGTEFYNNLKSIVLNNTNLFKGLEEVKYGFEPDYDFQTVNSLLEKYSGKIDQDKINDLKNGMKLSEGSEKVTSIEDINLDIPNIVLQNLLKDIPEGGNYNVYVNDKLELEGQTGDTVDIPFIGGIKPGTKIKVNFLDSEGNSTFIDEGEINEDLSLV